MTGAAQKDGDMMAGGGSIDAVIGDNAVSGPNVVMNLLA